VRYPITLTIPILWGDMDALGHVNNVRFFRWFESARIALVEKISGRPVGAAARSGPILATTTCDYLTPVHYPGTIVVGAAVGKIGTTSLGTDYGVWLEGEPDRLVARGTSVMVFVEYATGQKLPITPEMRDVLARL
jgi:acyl-CoA thioester hydrolase